MIAADLESRVGVAHGRARDDAWAPVTPEASFVTRYVRYAMQRTDAPPAAHEVMAVGALSALAGPGPRVPVATNVGGWRLALWVMYIVNSTRGRKTTVVNIVRDVLEAAIGSAALVEWEGSPQGLIQRLQERQDKATVFTRDEYSGLLQQMNRPGGHMASLPQLLIRAYDGGTLENIRTRKRTSAGQLVSDSDRVTDPYLVTLAASTYDSLMQRATIDNVLDGLLARFIFITGAATPRPVREETEALRLTRDAVIRHARAFATTCAAVEEVRMHADTLAALWECEQTWQTIADASSHPAAAGPSLKRRIGRLAR